MTDLLPPRAKCPEALTMTDNVTTEAPTPEHLSFHNRYPKVREDFPETWLWEAKIMPSNGVIELDAKAPDEITNWQSEVYCLSRSGIGVPQTNQSGVLKVMQPFFVELHSPRVIKRGEEVQMHYKIFNYLEHDIPVGVELEVIPSASVTSYQVDTTPVKCVRKGRSHLAYFRVRAHQLRNVNVSVAVHVINTMHHVCNQGNTTHTFYDVKDKVTKQVLVEPEGYTVEKYKSALLCADEFTNKSELTWNFERTNCVEQSENWFVSLVGDVTGPMPMNLDSLVSLPMGCGEQNLALLAYNIIALDYALAGKRVSGDMKETALRHLSIGYQRQLQYLHSSGAFSAFGPPDRVGSTWLTAFSVRVLAGLRVHLPDIGATALLENSARWLLGTQMENGCFRNEGQVFHREMKGGLRSDTSSIALAAYVIISLIDSEIPLLTSSVVQNTAYCLAALKYNHIQLGHSRDPKNVDKMYAFALATYAQIKIEGHLKNLQHKNEVLSAKMTNVKRQADHYPDEFYQSLLKEYADQLNNDFFGNDTLGDFENVLDSPMELRKPSLYHIREMEEDKASEQESNFLAGGGVNALQILKSLANRDSDMIWWEAGSLPVSIETTGYAMLALLAAGGEENAMNAVAAARWLSLHRGPQGGFLSTQDTLIGLQALCELREAMPSEPPSLSVSVRGPGRGRHFSVAPSERHKSHMVILPSVDGVRVPSAKLTVGVEGTGCLLVQATQKYNTLLKPTPESPFRLFSKVTTDGTFACKADQSVCMCAAVLEVCVSWMAPPDQAFPEMAILETRLPTGYSADRALLYQLLKEDNLLLRRVEESATYDTVLLYLSLREPGAAGRPAECYNLHLVGPRARTLPATLKVYDYYHTEIMRTMTYSIPEACPFDHDRRPHEEPMDLMTQESQPPEVDYKTDDGRQDWHVIDSDYDLDTPKSIEGVPPVFALPPPDFNKSRID